MADQLAAPPVNPAVSIRPVTTAAPERDMANAQTQLATVPVGTILEGFVVGRDGQNNPIMRTAVGDVQLQSDVFVKTGSTLTIRVDATQNGRIVTIDGMEPQDYAAQNTRVAMTEDTIMPSSLQATAQMPVEAEAQASTPALPTLPSAATLPGGIAQALPPLQAGTVPALFLNPPAVAGKAMPFAALPVMPLENIPQALQKLQAGTPLKVTLLQLSMPAGATPNAAPVATPPAASLLQAAAQPLQPSPLPQSGMAGLPAAKAALPQVPGPGTASPPIAGEVPHAPVGNTLPSTAPVAASSAAPASQATVSLPQPAGANMPPASNQPAPLPPTPVTPLQPLPAAMRPPSAPMASAPLPPNSFPAVVIGHEADGANIVQAHFGTMKVYTPTPLPIHSQLALRAEPDTSAQPAHPVAQTPYASPSTSTAGSSDDDSITPLSRDWPALDDVVAASGAQADVPQLQAVPQAIPHIDSPKLASTLLFFLSAVKSGDLRQWMGNKAVDALDARLPALAARMKTDMGQMQQLFTNSPIEQWSGMLWPVMVEGQTEYARFYLRDEPEDQGNVKPVKAPREQRFILELELSHLGDMQFDGFVRQATPAKQFDLIVRSARPLAPEISSEIRQRFETAIGVTGYKGYLGFQQGAQHFVRPLAMTATKDPNTILA